MKDLGFHAVQPVAPPGPDESAAESQTGRVQEGFVPFPDYLLMALERKRGSAGCSRVLYRWRMGSDSALQWAHLAVGSGGSPWFPELWSTMAEWARSAIQSMCPGTKGHAPGPKATVPWEESSHLPDCFCPMRLFQASGVVHAM